MKVRKIPERVCIGCQESKPKRELVRVVRTPEGELFVDETGKKSGRGAYICPQATCLRSAIKGKRLQRALEVSVPDEVWQQLETRITGETSS